MLAHKTTPCRQTLQENLGETSVNSGNGRINYEFTPVPQFIEQEIADPKLERLYRIILRFIRRGVADPSIRQLAGAMRRCIRQVKRYIRALVRLGKLVVTERRVTHNRNATNLYALPDLERGVGDKTVTEKKREVLNTTTPAPQREGDKSALKKFWEARFAQDRKDSQWRKNEFLARAMNWEVLKRWRVHKMEERARLQREITVGQHYPEPNEPQMNEEEQVYWANVIAEKSRAASEKYNTAMGRA